LFNLLFCPSALLLLTNNLTHLFGRFNVITIIIPPPLIRDNNYNSNPRGDYNDQQQQHQPRSKPDYGEVLLSSDIRHAPKSLDHFKRGYQERAAQREKEFYSRRHGPDGRRGGGGRGGRGRGGGGRTSSGGRGGRGGRDEEPWTSSYRDRPTVLQGLDINALADRLSPKLSNKDSLFQELDRTRQQNEYIFESGKAMTALLSVAARRKNIGLGHAVWDWVRATQYNMRRYEFEVLRTLINIFSPFLIAKSNYYNYYHSRRWTTPLSDPVRVLESFLCVCLQ